MRSTEQPLFAITKVLLRGDKDAKYVLASRQGQLASSRALPDIMDVLARQLAVVNRPVWVSCCLISFRLRPRYCGAKPANPQDFDDMALPLKVLWYEMRVTLYVDFPTERVDFRQPEAGYGMDRTTD